MSSSTVETREALATHVEVSEDTLSVELADGRTIAVPLAWYPRLEHASPYAPGRSCPCQSECTAPVGPCPTGTLSQVQTEAAR